MSVSAKKNWLPVSLSIMEGRPNRIIDGKGCRQLICNLVSLIWTRDSENKFLFQALLFTQNTLLDLNGIVLRSDELSILNDFPSNQIQAKFWKAQFVDVMTNIGKPNRGLWDVCQTQSRVGRDWAGQLLSLGVLQQSGS